MCKPPAKMLICYCVLWVFSFGAFVHSRVCQDTCLMLVVKYQTFDSPMMMMQYRTKIYIYSRCDNGDSVQNKCRERVKDNNLDLQPNATHTLSDRDRERFRSNKIYLVKIAGNAWLRVELKLIVESATQHTCRAYTQTSCGYG